MLFWKNKCASRLDWQQPLLCIFTTHTSPSTSQLVYWSLRPLTFGGSGGIVTLSEKLERRSVRRGGRRGRAKPRMSVVRLRQDVTDATEEEDEPQGAEGGPPGSEEPDAGEVLPEGADLAGLYALLQKTLRAQEREVFKQEQRWRSVQVQLNQFHDEFEELRHPRALPAQPAVPPPPQDVAPPPALLVAPPAMPPPALPAAQPAAPPAADRKSVV